MITHSGSANQSCSKNSNELEKTTNKITHTGVVPRRNLAEKKENKINSSLTGISLL